MSFHDNARAWLRELDGEATFGRDCQEDWKDDVAAMSDQKIERVMQRAWHSGWAGFVEESQREMFA